MMILNIHERVLPASLDEAGRLIDSLASPGNRLWPRDKWPPMRFDKPLQIGAKGGHGPIRYFIDSYDAGRRINFRFTAPKGFHGMHRFEIEQASPDSVRLRHVLEMRIKGSAMLSWPFIFRPLHDALIEDALDRAEIHFSSSTVKKRQWSVWVKLLRWALSPNRKQSRKK